jgi:antitoxin (DNA-binding transcriptional repressor) of toxin-antitoxin stability system
MEASIVDLRYKMKDVLKALERNEAVTILYRGKQKGIIVPVRRSRPGKVAEHPFFGMHAEKDKTVEEMMDELRGGRT